MNYGITYGIQNTKYFYEIFYKMNLRSVKYDRITKTVRTTQYFCKWMLYIYIYMDIAIKFAIKYEISPFLSML